MSCGTWCAWHRVGRALAVSRVPLSLFANYHPQGYNCPGHGYRDYDCGWSAGVRDLFKAGVKEFKSGIKEHYWETGKDYLGQYDTEIYTRGAVEYLENHFENHGSTKFFMWMAHHGMHGFKDSDPDPESSMMSEGSQKYLDFLRDRVTVNKFFDRRITTAAVAMTVDYSLYR